MKKKRKCLAGILIAALIGTMLPGESPANAETSSAEISNAAQLTAAVEECNMNSSSQTVRLTEDVTGITEESALVLETGSLTIDLNGYAIVGSGLEAVISCKSNGSLVIQDSSMSKNGKVESEDGKIPCVSISGGSLRIEGGAFHNTKNGTSLYIAENVEDNAVTLSGGSFQGKIERIVSDTSRYNYKAFYGSGSSTDGILASDFVLTDNSVFVEENSVSTAATVKVVEGSLVKLHTNRNRIEEYGNDIEAAEYANNYSMAPISVGVDKTVYSNSNNTMVPVVDETRISNGNSYEFYQWYDQNGNQSESVADYLEKYYGSVPEELSALWQAKVNNAAGLQVALNDLFTKRMQLVEDISTDMALQDSIGMYGKVLDWNGKTINYTGSSEPALTINSNNFHFTDSVGNGGINCSNGAPCVAVEGTAVVEEAVFRTTGSPVMSINVAPAGGGSSKILSAVLETTATDGCALMFKGAADIEEIKSILGYLSSDDMVIDENGIYIKSPKLLVSEEPIAYEVEAAQKDMGMFSYGAVEGVETLTVSNEKSGGDIVITEVSLDTAGGEAFELNYEGEKKILAGEAAEVYEISLRKNLAPGNYSGTIQITYRKMDGTTGTCQQKVTVVVTPKVLTITDPELTKTKEYDGNSQAQVTAGVLQGVLLGDEISVKASAVYDSADAGSGKKITVTYTLSGADREKYYAPETEVYSDGIIKKAKGSAHVTMPDFLVGEEAASPVLKSATNGIEAVTCYYKPKDASDKEYSQRVPEEAGIYTIKAVFAETANYSEAVAVDEFVLSYLETPEQPYILSGKEGNNGWYLSPVTFHAPEGFTLSSSQEGNYTDSYVIDSSTNTAVIYLKSATGAVTRAVSVAEIKIDTKAPVIQGIEDGETCYADEVNVIITDENLYRVSLNGKEVEIEKGRAELILKPSTGKYSIIAEDKAGNCIGYTVTIEERWVCDGIEDSGKKYLNTNKLYKLGSGRWKVSGDSTVYESGRSFYVTAEGEYEFMMQ